MRSFVRIVTVSTSLAVMSASAFAGTTLKSSVPPTARTCSGGTCDANYGVLCSTNAECDFGTLSHKSKMVFQGDGDFKIVLKDVVDADGAPATGEYILPLRLAGQFLASDEEITLKVPVTAGVGKAEADLTPFMQPIGEAVELFIPGDTILTPLTNPADCPGKNDADEILARQGDPDCTLSEAIGVVGVSSGVPTALKSSIAPVQAVCDGGYCPYSGSCAVNADCDQGTLSPNSKASINGLGQLKVRLRGVLNRAGAPVSTSYILHLGLYADKTAESVSVKIPLAKGNGAVDVDLSSFMPVVGNHVRIVAARLYTPPDNPADCPGLNTAADIAARQGDIDCHSGTVIGVVGVASEN